MNASSLGFVLNTSTLKDWVTSFLWPNATRRFPIEEVGDFASVYEVTQD